MPSVDLVVIARNSASQLREIYGDEDYRSILSGFFGHLWYVDSSSTDESVAVMRAAGFSCLQVGPGGRLSAAASRATAAAQSAADLLFFLDGDMVLESPAQLQARMADYLAARTRDPRLCGFTGRTLDVYPDGGERLRGLRADAAGHAPSFGGFVALERQALLAAGNWNGDVIANEELELHARLRRAGRRVLYLPAFGVRHYTVASSALHELAAAYLPLRPDRYGALGLAVRAATRAGALPDLVRLMPEPFVLAAVLAALPLGWCVAGGAAMPVLLAGFAAWVGRRRGVRFNVVVPAMLLSLPWGLARFRHLPVQWRSLAGSEGDK